MSIADRSVVQDQYADSTRLERRISIHEKYSRNKQPFGEWIISHYELQPGFSINRRTCIHRPKCRMDEVFFARRRQFDAGVLEVRQGELPKYGGKRPAQTVLSACEYRFEILFRTQPANP